MRKFLFVILLILTTSFVSNAQIDRTKTTIWSYINGLEYELKAGVNIGGTTPIPFPIEIRSINSYSPNLSLNFGAEITKWFERNKRTGIKFGIRFSGKSMTTEATTKNYGMEIVGDGGSLVKGMWTGQVNTKVNNAYISIPVLFAYSLSSRCKLKAGAYFSYLLSGDFSGYVSEGYLRENDPTGDKVQFYNGKIATYDFSSNLRKFDCGAELGFSWLALKHFNVNADLMWGLMDIFKKDFKTVKFNLYPIYLSIGFGYVF